MKFLMLTVLLVFSLPSYGKREPSSWTTTSAYEKVPSSETNRSVLTFINGTSTSSYRPTEAPFGLVSTQRVVLNKQEYFVTTWPQGARTAVFRVFNPEVSGADTLCEKNSFSESAKLKIGRDQQLKIQVFDESGDESWSDCNQSKTEVRKSIYFRRYLCNQIGFLLSMSALSESAVVSNIKIIFYWVNVLREPLEGELSSRAYPLDKLAEDCVRV